MTHLVPKVEISKTDPLDSSPVWENVSAYVREFTSNVGRSSELDRFSVGTHSVNFDNNTRVFDPSNTSSPLNGWLLPMRRIRCRLTMSGVDYPVFDGFVRDFPQSYDDQPNKDASTHVDVYGAGYVLQRDMGTMFEEQTRALGPVCWYRFRDSRSLSCPDEMGNYHGTYMARSADSIKRGSFSTPPGATSVLFNEVGAEADNPGVMLPPKLATDVFYSDGSWTVCAWVRMWQVFGFISFPVFPYLMTIGTTLALGSGLCFVALGADQDGRYKVGWRYDPNSIPYTIGADESNITLVDGNLHFVAYKYDSATDVLSIYVDGFLDTWGPIPAMYPTAAQGWIAYNVSISNGEAVTPVPIEVSEFQVYDRALSLQEITNLHNSGSSFSGDDMLDRVGRVLDFAGWPNTRRTISDVESVIRNEGNTAGKVWDYLQSLALVEDGRCFEGADGSVVFRGRRYEPATTNVGDNTGYIRYVTGYPRQSFEHVFTVVRIQSSDGMEYEISATPAEVADFGLKRTLDLGEHQVNLSEIVSKAGYFLSTRKTVANRVDSIMFNLRGLSTANAATILNLTIGEKLRFYRTMPSSPHIDITGWIESRSVEYSGIDCYVTFNISPDYNRDVHKLGTAALGTAKVAY